MCLFFSLSPKAFRLFSFFFPRIPKCFNDVTLGGIVFGGRGRGRLFCFVQNRKTCSSILGNFLISLIISSFLFSPLFHFGTALFEMFSLTDRFSNILIFSLLFVNSLCCTPYYGRFPQVLPSNFIFIVLFSFMKAIFFYCSENGLFLFFLF